MLSNNTGNTERGARRKLGAQMNHSILDMPWSENPLGSLSEDIQCTVGEVGLKVRNSDSAGYITN